VKRQPVVTASARCTLAMLVLMAIAAACAPDTEHPLHPGESGATEASGPVILAELQGTKWILDSYGPVSAPVTVLEEPIVTAEFTSDQTVRGMAGCNTYAANFELNNLGFALGDIRRTPFGCPDEAAWNQETSYLAALDAAESLTLEGETLVITYGDGKLLFIQESSMPAVSLTGKQWRLVAFEANHTVLPPVPGTMITAEFAGDSVMGLAGCNSYSGAYVQQGQDLAIVEMVVTIESCLGKDVMAQETAYLAALRAADSVTSDEDIMMVHYEGGALIFTAEGVARRELETPYQTRDLQ
jgi:heat shock protein HslJ